MRRDGSVDFERLNVEIWSQGSTSYSLMRGNSDKGLVAGLMPAELAVSIDIVATKSWSRLLVNDAGTQEEYRTRRNSREKTGRQRNNVVDRASHETRAQP